MPRVLIVAEHASARFGGEAALPLHYFRVLRARGLAVWLVVHARTRDELRELFGEDSRIHYVEDSWWHRLLYRVGFRLPARIAYLTTGFVSRLSTQWLQRRFVRRLVRSESIDVIHQPIPVSPREPSMPFGIVTPVIIGPMNGSMDYPPAFRKQRSMIERVLVAAGRAGANVFNAIIPGKRDAALLLVANSRTREALPAGLRGRVVELVENGVDLGIWRPSLSSESSPDAATFVFMGRLVDWKAVDLLLRAFALARERMAMRLWIIGDGDERARLGQLAAELGLDDNGPDSIGSVHFAGWLPQSECASWLARADCLVLPSLLECGGAVVLEAMALGKPVIATAWGGPVDYLDSSCGVLLEPNGAESLQASLASAMVETGGDAELRARLGAAGRKKVVQEFDWDVKVTRMLGLYAEAIEANRQPR